MTKEEALKDVFEKRLVLITSYSVPYCECGYWHVYKRACEHAKSLGATYIEVKATIRDVNNLVKGINT